MKNKGLILAVVLVAAAVIAGLLVMSGQNKKPSMDEPAATPDISAAVSTDTVTITDYMFGPKAAKVKVGDTVTWTNNDPVKHSIVADTASADAPDGPLIGKGETYTFTFKKAGTYAYHCAPHPYMHGTVVVTQ